MRVWVCALAAFAATIPALADDGSASLAAGGIVFTKNIAVRMAAEDLYISPKQVRVRFEFVNDTANDVETLVAFPVPDIDNESFYFEPLGKTADDPGNFINFLAQVDGKPIAVRIEQRAFIKNRDVTATIEAAGLPLNIVTSESWRKKFDAIPQAKRNRLIAKGVLADDTPSPLWTVRTKFYWTQRFPAHRTVVVEHSYQPVTGLSFFGEGQTKSRDMTHGVDYCFDAPTRATTAALSKAHVKAHASHGELLFAFWTDYILKTANTWNGPIGRFHLTLDKLKPENVLSLCWDGELKKTGPTTFESTLTNFAPTRDIHLLVLE